MPTLRPPRRLAVALRPLSRRLRVARVLTSTLRFLANEAAGTSSPTIYSLRDPKRYVVVRHRSSDIDVLHDLWCWDYYSFPPDVLARLHALGRVPRVLDLGAHVGLFGVYLDQRFPGAPITAFEPDAGHRRLLGAATQLNALPWTVVAACAGTRDCEVPFAEGEGWASHVPETSERANTRVQQVDVFPYLADTPDLVKVNIEGGEWDLLADPRMPSLAPPLVVLEYHERGAPGPPAEAAHQALRHLGYEVTKGKRWTGGGLLWGVHR